MWTVLETAVPFLIEKLKKKEQQYLSFLRQPMHDCLHTVHLPKELRHSSTVSLQEPQCSHTDIEKTALWEMVM